jgi:hypothetical protein
MANGLFAGGDGSLQNPFLIEDAHDLDAVRNGMDKHYKIIKNINLDIKPYNEGEGWIPIYQFTGTFDGNNKIISGMRVNIDREKQTQGYGLFRELKNAIVSNLAIQKVSFNFESNVYDIGFLAGRCYNSKIKNVIVSGYMKYTYQKNGGIIGHCYSSSIEECKSDIVFEVKRLDTVSPTLQSRTGGIVGQVEDGGVIRNCYSTGRHIEDAYSYTGGIAGYLYSTNDKIYDSYSTFYIQNRNNRIGGLTGSANNSTVLGGFWDVEVTNQLTSSYGIGLTTQQMKTAQTFIDAGWDKELNDDGEPVWILKDGEYPKLWFEEETVPNKFLLHDTRNGNIYTVKDDNLESINSTLPIKVDDFEKGTEELSDIIGERNILTDMNKVSIGEFGDYNVYEYPISGYSKLYNVNIYDVGRITLDPDRKSKICY